MKKSKLSLKKFKVAKLNNAGSIYGGTNTNNGGDGTKDTIADTVKCIKDSEEFVRVDE